MKLLKACLATFIINIFISLPILAFDLPLGDNENEIGIKISHNTNEPFGKALPWGPSAIKLYKKSQNNIAIYVADTLKNRITKFKSEITTDNKVSSKVSFEKAIPLELPNDTKIGDFCLGYYNRDKSSEKIETVFYVCDTENPIVYVFDCFTGKKLTQIGSSYISLFLHPYRIEENNGFIYILDSGYKKIFVFNGLKLINSFDTDGKNFTIEENHLYHIAKIDNNKVLQSIKLPLLNSNSIINYSLKAFNQIETDYIYYKNSCIFVGSIVETENQNKLQYQLIQIDKEQKLTKLNTNFPVSFMTNSFINLDNDKLFQIKFDETKPDKIIIDELSNNLNDSEG